MVFENKIYHLNNRKHTITSAWIGAAKDVLNLKWKKMVNW
jgi:hypothetical protein